MQSNSIQTHAPDAGLSIGTTLTSGNIVMGHPTRSGGSQCITHFDKGIRIATGDVLNRYEEGVFTPTLSDTSDGSGFNHAMDVSLTTGSYTVIGNVVHIFMNVAWTTSIQNVNEVYVRGIPALGYLDGSSLDIGLADSRCSIQMPPSGTVKAVNLLKDSGSDAWKFQCMDHYVGQKPLVDGFAMRHHTVDNWHIDGSGPGGLIISGIAFVTPV